MASLPRAYLDDKIGPIIGPASRDGVIEYLLSCDSATQQDEMVLFLEQLGGRNPKFRSIIKQYALMEKNLSRGATASGQLPGAEVGNSRSKKKNAKHHPGGSKNGDQKMVTDSNCGCMGTRHPLWGSCSSCGRIYCEEEQVRSCKYCSQPVQPKMSGDDAEAAGLPESTVAAYRHKVWAGLIAVSFGTVFCVDINFSFLGQAAVVRQ